MHKNFIKNSSLVTLAFNHLIYRMLRCDELICRLITPCGFYIKMGIEADTTGR